MISFFRSQIQGVQLLRDEIEQIDVYQLRTHATSYSKEFGTNRHHSFFVFVFIKNIFQSKICINIQLKWRMRIIFNVKIEIVIHFDIISVKNLRQLYEICVLHNRVFVARTLCFRCLCDEYSMLKRKNRNKM